MPAFLVVASPPMCEISAGSWADGVHHEADFPRAGATDPT